MFKSLKILIVFLLFVVFNAHSATIATVKFEGLTKTEPEFLYQLIECKPGIELNSDKIKHDEQTLKNLNLFFSVESRVTQKDSLDYFDLVFIIKEAKYLYPFIAIEGFKDQLKLQVGLNNINWRGRNQTIGFLYQYYDRHSISFYQKTPRHKNGKTGHEVSLAKYSTIEPLYFNDTTSNFNFDNYSVSLVGKYWFNNKINLDFGGMLMHEDYLQLDDAQIDLPGKQFSFFKYQIKSSLTCNSVDSHYEFLNGYRLNLYVESIQTKNYPMASFFKLKTKEYYYKQIKKKGNIAIHHTFGIATNNPSPFSPFVLDGFLNIRGIGNRVSRGTAENILNIEYRYTLLNKKHFTLQGVAFTDLGSLRQAGEDFKSMFAVTEMNYYSGLGLRLHSKIFYKAIFRIDYGINLQDINQGGFTFGLGHFF